MLGTQYFREVVLDEYKDLTSELSEHCNELLEIHEGQHKIEFSVKVCCPPLSNGSLTSRARIQLPLDVVSSIEKENHGSIRYTCIAVLGMSIPFAKIHSIRIGP